MIVNGGVAGWLGATRVRRSATRLATLAIVIGVWALLAHFEVWDKRILPGPDDVWRRFTQSMTSTARPDVVAPDGTVLLEGKPEIGLRDAYLYQHLWASLWRILNGLFWAIVVGVPLGLLLATRPLFQLTVEPYVNFIRALPPLGYFSLLLLWFGNRDTSKIWLLFLAALAPIALSVVSGARGIPQDRIDGARALGAGRLQVLAFVVLPSALPDLFVGIRLAIGFAWTTVVAAETTNGLPGIGGLAWSTKSTGQIDVAILAVIVIGLTAVALDQAVKALDQRVVPWRGRS